MAEITTVQMSEKGSVKRVRTYQVKEIWKTLQGEGFFAGRPAVFVRLVGCNMWSGSEKDRERDMLRSGANCPLWCDTDFTKEGSCSFSAVDLAKEIREIGGNIRFCVLTGGEPLLQIDASLVRALHDRGFQVATETNGTVSLQETCWDDELKEIVAPDWIVCSPKLPEDQLRLEYFDELKLVVPDYMPQGYQSFIQRQRKHFFGEHLVPLLWIQPEDGPRLEEASLLAVETALAFPEWRVSVQTHKVLGVE